MTFRIGQPIVSINNKWIDGITSKLSDGPPQGTIVHIVGFGLPNGVVDPFNYVWLSLKEWPTSAYFRADLFRPLTENKTDIAARSALFNKLLNPDPQEFVKEFQRQLDEVREPETTNNLSPSVFVRRS